MIDEVFHESLVSDHAPEEVTGDPRGYPLRPVAAAIDDVLGSFDSLQEALGLPPGGEPRHRRFLCSQIGERDSSSHR
jgi:hypothetical protein